MLKKFPALAGAAVLATAGIALSAAPAQAAPPANAPGSIFLHGTTRLGNFPSRTTCEAHAKYEVNLVNKTSGMTLLPGVQNKGAVGSVLRFNCYPVRGGTWAYLTAYTTKSGNPIQKQDLYFDTSNRSSQVAAGTSVDTERVWPFAHVTEHKVGTVSVATCNAQLAYVAKKVQSSFSLRIVGSDTSCTVRNGMLGYELDYLSTSSTGYPYDKVPSNVTALQPMMDVLGYQFPGTVATNKVSPFHLTTRR